MKQTSKTVGTKQTLGAVAMLAVWLAGAAGALAADPPTEPIFTNSLGMVLVRNKLVIDGWAKDAPRTGKVVLTKGKPISLVVEY